MHRSASTPPPSSPLEAVPPDPSRRDAMDEFGGEAEVVRPRAAASTAPSASVTAKLSPGAAERGRRFVVVVVLSLLSLGQVPFVVLWATQSHPAPALLGTLAVETEPAGMAVRVDGKAVGRAPVSVLVPAGRRMLQIGDDRFERAIAVRVASGEVHRERVEFLPGPPVPVMADPAPAAKTRAVAATSRPAPPGSMSGWLRVASPVPLRIVEAGRLLGTTEVDRLMLPVGEHVLDLSSEELRFSTQQTVTVAAGETASLTLRLPTAPVSINAKPWAEAWIDGERVGDTPLGNLMRPIGRHQIVLRHPDFGERRETVLVTLNQTARVSVDMRQGK